MKNFTDTLNEKVELTLAEKIKKFFEKTVNINSETDIKSIKLEGVDNFIKGVETLIMSSKINEISSFKYNHDYHRFKTYKINKEELKKANLTEDVKKDLNKQIESSSGLLCIYSETLEEVGVYGAFTDNFLENVVIIPRKLLISVS